MSRTVTDPRARELVQAAEPRTWSFIGDSVTAASWHTWGGRGYPELFHERLRELGRVRDVVVNAAVSGWRVEDLDGDLEHVCLRHHPHAVVIGTGLNDTKGGADGVGAFVSTYRRVVERIRHTTGALVVVQTPNGTLPTAPDHVVRHLDRYVEAIRSLARDVDAVLVDHHSAWAATPQDSTFHWLGHGCHPNAYGHRAMARTLMQVLGVWDPGSSRTCRLTIP
ncbi:SGNH/GDSL hydrolase family protein [uncultured Georgenia sp.]|uniref:SGNH/GDSL hydrolase family protein n=1 Tax=uncultured Georgenia sp. TaxID=378209 RepID=UPI00261FB5B4|nr:SGNH/GDSL hydrolase family protein [uncultured Georgenia sp.]